MSVRRLLAAVAAALPVGIVSAAPAAAHAAIPPVAASVYTFSLGRLGAAAGALLGLAAVVVAGLALSRPAGRPGAAGPLRARAAMVAGLLGTALGALVAATADGGLGTGNGLGGAYVAMLLGLLGTGLGALARARARRTG